MLDVVPTKHRSLALLVAVLLAQVLLLAMQIRRQEEGGSSVRLIRVWAVWLVSPLQRAGAWTVDRVSNAWGSYVDLRDLREQHQRQAEELERLKLRNHELESRAAEANRLAALLEFRSAHEQVPMLAARVIGSSAVGAVSLVIYVNRGEQHGVRRNMAVITPDGVVGKTLEVYPETSQVLLMTDTESGVGALLAESRTHGVVRGQGQPWTLMDFVVSDEPVVTGQRIVTSGEDRIFPKDLPVGTVMDTAPGAPFQRIRVRPAARLDRLEEVLILLTREELKAAGTEGEPVEAKQE